MDFATRPTLLGFGGAVSAGHYLATEAGLRMLGEGGNAADAACAMGLALQLLEPHMNGPAGEVPVLLYWGASDRVYAISGQGPAPRAASVEGMRALGLDLIPGDGLLAATVPAALDAWCLLLERFGSKRFADVAAPARALAERGFPMYPFLRNVLRFVERELRAFLDCGLPCRGFLRVRCEDCGGERLVAFSFKTRGFCPSCGARRMADTAAHLVDRVFPEVPVGQYVVSLPFAGNRWNKRGSRTSDNEENVKSRGELRKTGGFPHVVAEAVEALRPK